MALDEVHTWQDVLVTEWGKHIDRAILDAYPRFLLKKGLEMTLDEVRLLKEELKKDLEFKQTELLDLEEEEARLETADNFKSAELDVYLDRLTGLLNDVETGSDFRISFRKNGEANRTNLLPPGKVDDDLRGLALSMLLERMCRRADRADIPITLIGIVNELRVKNA